MAFKNEKNTYSSSTIDIDGNEYIGCIFTDCTLRYSGGPVPSFIECSLYRSNFEFSGSAERTLGFLAGMYHGGFKPVVESTFDAIRNMVPHGEEV